MRWALVLTTLVSLPAPGSNPPQLQPLPRLRVALFFRGAMPKEVSVKFADREGAALLECAPSEFRGLRCLGHLRASGENRVTVRYRAADGRAESVTATFRLQGDEEDVVVEGTFNNDARLLGLQHHRYRAADRVVLKLVAPPLRPGDLPGFTLTNGSDAELQVTAQGHVVGYPVLQEEDGRWGRSRSRITASCGSGMGQGALLAGVSAPAGEMYLILPAPLRRGTHLFVVEFDDEETLGDDAVSRRVTVRFEVPKDVHDEFDLFELEDL